jgi:hypothetical protein
MKIVEGSQPWTPTVYLGVGILQGANNAPFRMTACFCVWATDSSIACEEFGLVPGERRHQLVRFDRFRGMNGFGRDDNARLGRWLEPRQLDVPREAKLF